MKMVAIEEIHIAKPMKFIITIMLNTVVQVSLRLSSIIWRFGKIFLHSIGDCLEIFVLRAEYFLKDSMHVTQP